MLPSHFRAPTAAALLALGLLPLAVLAQVDFEEDFDDPYKPWAEVAVQLPSTPEAENLLAFEVDGTTNYEFALDGKSLSLGKDGVLRYTIVSTSLGGARNVSYEGIRCATFERKLYAFGQPDGSWSRSRRDKWEPIRGGANRYQATLAKHYFCDGRTVSGATNQILFRIRHKQPLDLITGR